MKLENTITVVIPAYNCENTIHRSINSLKAQSYSNFFVIIVNDGSTDGTLSKLTELVSDDKRFSVASQPNGGPGAARNKGILLAGTEYIGFLDSDDVFKPAYLETMMAKIVNSNTDIVVCDYEKITPTGEVIKIYKARIYNDLSGEIAARLALRSLKITSFISNKIFKRSLFDDVSFPEKVKVNEDSATIWRLMLKASQVAFVEKVLFSYIQTNGSTMMTFNRSRLSDRIVAAKIVRKHIELVADKISLDREYQVYYVLNVVLSGFKQILSQSDSKVDDVIRFIKCLDYTIFTTRAVFRIWSQDKMKFTVLLCLKFACLTRHLMKILVRNS